MMNYMRAEFYKVFHRKYTWITLVVVLALEALLVSGYLFINGHGGFETFYSGAAMLCVMLSIGFYAAMIICDMVFASQYKSSTLKNEVAFGIPRHRIYLGKFLTSLVLSLLFLVVMTGFYLALCWLTLYRDPERDAYIMQVVGYCLATALPLWIGVLACTNACLFLIRSELAASIVAVCVFVMIPPVLEVCGALFIATPAYPVFQFLHRYMPTVMVDTAYTIAGDWAYCGQAWIVGAIWLAVFTALGISGFRKREIQ